LDGILKKNDTGFFVGHQLTFVDLGLWYWLENLTDQGLINVSKYEHLAKFKAAIEARPHIAAYRNDPKRFPIQYSFGRYVIHSYPQNTNVFKSLIAAEYGGLKVEYPQNFAMGKENKTPEYLKKNPTGEVPLLDSPDGPIYESNAIAKYITRKGNDKGLYGANEYEASQIDQWIEWYRSQLEMSLYTWIVPVAYGGPFDKEKYDAAKGKVAKNLPILNSHLNGKEWLVGKRVTLADIVLFSSLARPLQHLFDPEFMTHFGNINNWAKRCAEQPHFKTHFPTFEFCTKEKQPGELARR